MQISEFDSGAFAADVFHLPVLVANPAVAGENRTEDIFGCFFDLLALFGGKVIPQFALEIGAGPRDGTLGRGFGRDGCLGLKLSFGSAGLLAPFCVAYRHTDPPTKPPSIFLNG